MEDNPCMMQAHEKNEDAELSSLHGNRAQTASHAQPKRSNKDAEVPEIFKDKAKETTEATAAVVVMAEDIAYAALKREEPGFIL